MRLIRYGYPGEERPGLELNGNYYGLNWSGGDYDEDFFGGDGVERLRSWLASGENDLEPLEDTIRLGPPVLRPSKIICVGLNYADHARESGAAIPDEPIIFFKSVSALSGPNDPVILPRNSNKTDWEVELAVVIGKRASYIEEKDANQHIAGYCLHNDYSERAFQLERGGQWVKGKSCDSFAPMGPFIATPEEIGDIDNLRLWLMVNGRMMQESNTSNMIFMVPFLISYISQFMTLMPGDILSTGTPPGVGMGIKPMPVYLNAGDVVELGIEGLGSSKQIMKEWK